MDRIDHQRLFDRFQDGEHGIVQGLEQRIDVVEFLARHALAQSSRMRPVASTPTSAVIRRVSRSSRICASILRPGSSSLMSVVSQAGPVQLGAQALEKAAEPSGYRLRSSWDGYDTGSVPPRRIYRDPRRNRAAGGRPQFGAHHRRRLARPARQFSGYSRARPTPIGFAKPCSTGCSTPSRVLAAWICLPDPVRSDSRPCRGERRKWCSSSRRRSPRATCRRSCSAWAASAAARSWKWERRAILRCPAAFDIVFLDPPFGQGCVGGICRMLDAGGGRKWEPGVPGEREVRRRAAYCRRIGNCSNRSRRARWGIIWRASMRGIKPNE
jgi:hypothetical protein